MRIPQKGIRLPILQITDIFQMIIASLAIGSLYALLGIGLNVVYSVTRLVNIAHGDWLMLGAYLTYSLFSFYQISPIISLAVVGLVTGSIGGLLYKSLFSRIVHRAKSLAEVEVNSYLIFFGLLLVVENLVTLRFSSLTRGYSWGANPITYFGVSILVNRLFTAIFSAVIIAALVVVMRATWLGKAIRFAMDDRDAAKLMGVNVERIFALCCTIGFAIAGMAGNLVGMIYEVSPTMGLSYTLIAFTVIVLAGTGNFGGTLLAGLSLGFAETFGVYFTTPALRVIIAYSILIIVVVLRRRGS